MISETDTIDADELLIERIKAGDMAAYNVMVIRHYDRIFSRVLQLLNNKQDAEEVTQDAFIRAHRGLENFRGDASFALTIRALLADLPAFTGRAVTGAASSSASSSPAPCRLRLCPCASSESPPASSASSADSLSPPAAPNPSLRIL